MRLTWRLLASLPPEAVPRGADGSAVVALVDVRRLGSLNQAVGAAAADQLLDAVEDRIRGWAGPAALLAHLGAGRYAAVCPGPAGRELHSRAQHLRLLLAEPVRTAAGELSRTASVGVASGTEPIGELLLHAEAALAAARQSDAEPLCFWDGRLHESVTRGAQLEVDLQYALRTGCGFLLHYQPSIDLRTGELRAMEALARWQHPRLGMLDAQAFIGVATASGFIGALGEWALETAFAQRARWARSYPRSTFVVRVNLPATHLADHALPGLVRRLLAEHRLTEGQVGVEFTEETGSLDVHRVRHVLGELKSLGLSIAIDDFGVAHSSPERLRAFPFDAVKIDRQFVRGIATDEANRTVVEAVVRLAELLGCVPVAEGVENGADAAALLTLGCYKAQGNWLMPPADPESVADLVRRGRLHLPRLG